MVIKFAFNVKDVQAYIDVIQTLLPEYPYTDVRSIAEYCHVYCDSPNEDNVYKAIHQYYEVFSLNKPDILGDPSY